MPHAQIASLGPDDAGAIKLEFCIPYQCEFGQRLAVVGGSECLGNWNPATALPMEWQDGHVWVARCQWCVHRTCRWGPGGWQQVTRRSVSYRLLRVSARLTRNAIALHLPPRRPEDGSTRLEFKYIVQNPDRSAAQWQPGANREVLLDLTQDVALVQVQDEWSTGKQIVRVRYRWGVRHATLNGTQPGVGLAADRSRSIRLRVSASNSRCLPYLCGSC